MTTKEPPIGGTDFRSYACTACGFRYRAECELDECPDCHAKQDAAMTASKTTAVPPFPGGYLCLEFWPPHDKGWIEAGTHADLFATEAEAVKSGERSMRIGTCLAYRVIRLPGEPVASAPASPATTTKPARWCMIPPVNDRDEPYYRSPTGTLHRDPPEGWCFDCDRLGCECEAKERAEALRAAEHDTRTI